MPEDADLITEYETQLLVWTMQSLRSRPNVDYDKLAELASMSNPRSAANAWYRLRKKFGLAPQDGTPLAARKQGSASKDDKPQPSYRRSGRKRAAETEERDAPLRKKCRSGPIRRSKEVLAGEAAEESIRDARAEAEGGDGVETETGDARAGKARGSSHRRVDEGEKEASWSAFLREIG